MRRRFKFWIDEVTQLFTTLLKMRDNENGFKSISHEVTVSLATLVVQCKYRYFYYNFNSYIYNKC